MDLYTIDVETFYSSSDRYNLRLMPMVDYIMDDRFELISLSYKRNDEPPVFLFGDDAEAWLEDLPSESAGLLAQNTQFDAAVLAWRFGKRFAFHFDTMSMANAVVRPFTNNGHVNLGAIGKHFGFGVKGDFVTAKMNGKRRADVTPDLMSGLIEYNNHDVHLAKLAFNWMLPLFPKKELLLIDQIVRMYVEPRLALRADVLAVELDRIRTEKQELLDRCNLADRKALMSNDQFAAMLALHLGDASQIPRKISPTTGLPTYAFAKSDKKFTDLVDHPNPIVSNLVQARLGHKSTILETRTEKLLGIAQRHGWLAVPLAYWGAHTGRLSGAGGLNLQNLTRGSQLRYAIVPLGDGKVLVVVDASQIEARFLVTWAGQWDVVRQFENGDDVYANFASRIYGFAVNKQEHPDERFVGKVGVLSLGYGAGAETFWQMLWTQRTPAMVAKGFEPDMELSYRTVVTYREANDEVNALWKRGDKEFVKALAGEWVPTTSGPFYFEHGAMHLPNNTRVYYPDLRLEKLEDDHPMRAKGKTHSWFYGHGRMKKSLYGPKVVENATQAATRIIITDAWLECAKHWPVALQVHDELLFVVDTKEADACLEKAHEELRRRPDWMPNIPLFSEGQIAMNYGDAK